MAVCVCVPCGCRLTTSPHCFRCMQPGLAKMKVSRPSDIQAAVIPEILSMENVAMQSYTGSGKVSRGSAG